MKIKIFKGATNEKGEHLSEDLVCVDYRLTKLNRADDTIKIIRLKMKKEIHEEMLSNDNIFFGEYKSGNKYYDHLISCKTRLLVSELEDDSYMEIDLDNACRCKTQH